MNLSMTVNQLLQGVVDAAMEQPKPTTELRRALDRLLGTGTSRLVVPPIAYPMRTRIVRLLREGGQYASGDIGRRVLANESNVREHLAVLGAAGIACRVLHKGRVSWCAGPNIGSYHCRATRTRVVEHLALYGPQSARDLVDALHIRSKTVTACLRRLHAQRVVTHRTVHSVKVYELCAIRDDAARTPPDIVCKRSA